MFVMFCRYSILWKWLVHILSVVDQLKLKPVVCWRKASIQRKTLKNSLRVKKQKFLLDLREQESVTSAPLDTGSSAQNDKISLSKRTLRHLNAGPRLVRWLISPGPVSFSRTVFEQTSMVPTTDRTVRGGMLQHDDLKHSWRVCKESSSLGRHLKNF